jgi:putative glycerol-1-phosphate prenyltransferase
MGEYNNISNHLRYLKSKGKKALAVLIDPDKSSSDSLNLIVNSSIHHKPDFFFVGGSLITENNFDYTIRFLKAKTDVPIIIFPGNNLQISDAADAILFLSLISGRNPEMLIGRHVIAAPFIKQAGVEVLPVGYMLVDTGKMTSVAYMSNTTPIPSDKPDIAACTALAGNMLGLSLIYIDAGSGALTTISSEMIKSVVKAVDCPLIVGGGIRTPETLKEIYSAGADIAVVGNFLESNPSALADFLSVRDSYFYAG